MRRKDGMKDERFGLPQCANDYIAAVVKKMRYRKRARRSVGSELAAHFEDELEECRTQAQREEKCRRLIEGFGEAKLLAVLCRRAKKRCRPLWQKALVRSAQALGVLVLYWVACSLPLFLGKPTVRVNYAEWLSDRWRPAQLDVENAKRYYDRAAELYVEPPQALAARREASEWMVRDCNEAELELLAGWLGENQAAFDMLRKGAKTGHYWPVYDVNEADRTRSNAPFLWMEVNVLPLALESTASYRSLAVAWRGWVAYQAHLGAMDEAMKDSMVLLRFGLHLEGKGLLIEQMVGTAIEALGYSAMYDVLQNRDIPVDVLARVQAELASVFDEDRGVFNLDGEKVSWYDNIQRTFTDDGHGGGRALRYGLPFAAGEWRDNVTGVLLFDYPSRRETMAMVETYFQQAQEMLRTPPDRKESSAELEERVRTLQEQNLLLSVMVPAHARLAHLAWRTKTGEAALVTTVAILRYKAEKGSYPANLEELVQAGVLAKLPDDPFGKGPLTYCKTADGFRLYSWGENLTDDGGQPGMGQDGKPRNWAGNGDWVFWPVAQADN